MIKKEKERSWKEFADTLQADTRATRIFRTLKGMTEEKSVKIEGQVLNENNKKFITNESKAKLFVRKYADVSKVKREKKWDCEVKKEVRRQLMVECNNCRGSYTGICDAFRIEELNHAVRSLPRGKAAGPDGWHNEMFLHMTDVNKLKILHVCNLS